MQPQAKHANPEQRQSGIAAWKAALGIAAAAATLPVILFSGSEIGVEATESAPARRLPPRSEWMADYWGPQWADVEREILERDGGAQWLAQPVSEVDVPAWKSISAEFRGSFVEELLASREQMCEGFMGDRRTAVEQAQSTLTEDELLQLEPTALTTLVALAQSFDAAIETAASSAFDLVLELDDAIWSEGRFDRGLFYLPECTSVVDSTPKAGVAMLRAQTCGPWMVRYVVDCTQDPRIQTACAQIRALQRERAAALQAAAEEWRAR